MHRVRLALNPRPRRLLLALGTGSYLRWGRRWLRTWGASPDEITRTLAGDDLVRARYRTTHAVTVHRPADEVWPWLVQIGYGRAGWYSYDRLEPVHLLMERKMLRTIKHRVEADG